MKRLFPLLFLAACSGVVDTDLDHADSGVLQPRPGDRDGDGLRDEEEVAGWEIRVDANGFAPAADGSHLEVRRVFSDPDVADTDGDGLLDGDERRAQSDPQRADTDGDGLTDAEEVRVYATTPNAVDSDGDARDGDGAPNSRLFDGAEVEVGASPLLADTDADGLGDYREIIDGGSHPAIADLPRLELAIVDAPSVTLNAVEATENRQGLEAVSATLQGTRSATSTTDSHTNETTFGFRESVSNETSTEVSLNPLDWSVGASSTTTLEFEATQTFSDTTTHSTTRDSARTAQRSYEEAVTTEETRSVSYDSGTVRVALRLRNASRGITVNVSGVTIIVKRFDAAVGQMVVVGELSAVTPIDDNIAAGDGIEAVFENTGLAVADVKALLADPRALSFQIGRYSLRRIGRDGAPTVDYAALSEDLSRQCGLLVVDHGDGRVERYNVATNLRRDEMGRPVGTPLGELLDVLGLAVETRAVQGREVLWAVGDQDSQLNAGAPDHRFWGVIGPDVGADLRDIRVGPGQRVTFAYLRDDDGDTLLNREEFHIGTDPARPDTDDDGLNDAEDPNPLGVEVVEPDAPRIPADSLLGWWAIDHDAVVDQGPAERETELRCAVDPVDDRHGVFGGAIDFADHSEATRCYAKVDGLTLPEHTSLSLWIRRSETQISHGFIAGQYGRLSLSSPQSGPKLVARIGSHVEPTELAWAGSLDDWVHVAVTLSPAVADTPGLNRFALYVDGALVDEAIVEADALDRRIADTPCPEAFFFGGAERTCRDNRKEFSGALDDLRVYARGLEPAEVAALAAEAR